MNQRIGLIAALALILAAPLAGAATPKAAEDTSSPVATSATPAPRVHAVKRAPTKKSAKHRAQRKATPKKHR